MSLEQMQVWASELPEQLRMAVERATARGWPSALQTDAFVTQTSFDEVGPDGTALGGSARGQAAPTFVGGMGGSAVSAKISRSLLAPELTAPIEIGSDPLLPAWAGRSGPTGLISYSGQTWEVLALWEQLTERGAIPWVVASGGEIIERACAALALAVPLGSAGIDLTRKRLLQAAAGLAEERDLWATGAANPGRSPAELARALAGKRVAFVVSRESDLALAFRWKNQFEENAKQVAHVVLFPEAGHNEIEGWSRLREAALVYLETPPPPEESEGVARSRSAALEAVVGIAADAGIGVQRVPANSGREADRWTGFLSQILLADAVSLGIAEHLGIDPEPVPVLSSVKDAVRRGTVGGRTSDL